MSQSYPHHTIRDRDLEELRRAEHRHAKRIRDKAKMKEYMRALQHLRGEDDEGEE